MMTWRYRGSLVKVRVAMINRVARLVWRDRGRIADFIIRRSIKMHRIGSALLDFSYEEDSVYGDTDGLEREGHRFCLSLTVQNNRF
jgi:hypothetical protein